MIIDSGLVVRHHGPSGWPEHESEATCFHVDRNHGRGDMEVESRTSVSPKSTHRDEFSSAQTHMYFPLPPSNFIIL